jgi:transposase
MRQIRKIIELHRNGASKRETARIAGVSKNTAKDYLRAAAGSGIGLDSLLEMDDNALFAALKLNAKDVVRDPRHAALQVQTGRLLKELKKTGVTMQLLWEEYRAADPQGYGYTQFCRYLGEAKDRMDLRMHLDHKPGDMMMFDFAGEKLYYVNRATGELVACEVLVCVLPYSGPDVCGGLGLAAADRRDGRPGPCLAGLWRRAAQPQERQHACLCEKGQSLRTRLHRVDGVLCRPLRHDADGFKGVQAQGQAACREHGAQRVSTCVCAASQ